MNVIMYNRRRCLCRLCLPLCRVIFLIISGLETPVSLYAAWIVWTPTWTTTNFWSTQLLLCVISLVNISRVSRSTLCAHVRRWINRLPEMTLYRCVCKCAGDSIFWSCRNFPPGQWRRLEFTSFLIFSLFIWLSSTLTLYSSFSHNLSILDFFSVTFAQTEK